MTKTDETYQGLIEWIETSLADPDRESKNQDPTETLIVASFTWAYGNAAAANAAFRRAHANGIIEKSYTSTAGNTVWRVTDRARDIFALFGFLKMVKKD